jgi:hypothetical protein
MGDPTKVKVGPGLLYVNALGGTLTNLQVSSANGFVNSWASVDPDWVPLGYTEEGHEFANEPNFEPIEVAEELDALRYEQTGRQMRLSLAAAELTYQNITRAYNGGTIITSGSGATQVRTFKPPAIGEVTKLMIGWESQDKMERWVFYQCVQVGGATIARRKAPNKATVPMEFRLELPDPAVDTVPFVAHFADPA